MKRSSPDRNFSTRLRSNSDVFSSQGDPWVSDRERRRDYGLTSLDNPELDQFTKAHKAPERHDKGSEKRGSGRDPTVMRSVNARRAMRKEMKSKKLKPQPRPGVDRAQLREDIAARYDHTFRALTDD